MALSCVPLLRLQTCHPRAAALEFFPLLIGVKIPLAVVCVGRHVGSNVRDVLELHHERAGDCGWIRETSENSQEFRECLQLAPFNPLARIPYWEHLLGLVRQGLPATAYSAAMDPALARAHADLFTYLAAVSVSLFDVHRHIFSAHFCRRTARAG